MCLSWRTLLQVRFFFIILQLYEKKKNSFQDFRNVEFVLGFLLTLPPLQLLMGLNIITIISVITFYIS